MSAEALPNNQEPNQVPEDWAKLMEEESSRDYEQLYERRDGEGKKDYQKRLKKMQKLSAETLADGAAEEAEQGARSAMGEDGLRSQEYLDSALGKEELTAEAEYYQLAAKFAEAVKTGQQTEARAQQVMAQKLAELNDKIAKLRQDYESVGSVDDQLRYEEFLRSHDAENQANLAERERLKQAEYQQAIDNLTNALGGGEGGGDDISEGGGDDVEAGGGDDDNSDDETGGEGGGTEAGGEGSNEGAGEDGGEGGLELPFSEIDQTLAADRLERQNEIKGRLDKLRPNLAELYAKGRRLFDVQGNRGKFNEAREGYNELLNEYLKIKGEAKYEAGRAKIAQDMQERLDALSEEIEAQLAEFAQADEQGNVKTREEIDAERQRLIEEGNETLKREYGELVDALNTDVNADVQAALIEEMNALEASTIDRLDNGTICRKAVSKIINNKVLKGILITAGVAGLAVTGVGLVAGLAAGTMTVGLGTFTAAGVAAGAAKGGLSAAIMSRQSSGNSAVREFINEEEIRKGLEGIDVMSQGEDVANVTSWLLGQYDKAKESDLKSNRARTAISVGLGAALGGFMSGVDVNRIEHQDVTSTIQTGTTPTSYDFSSVENVSHQAGTGVENYFVNETNLVSSPSEFYKPGGMYDILIESGAHHGLTEGSNGGWSYPGTLSEWLTSESQDTVREALQTAAARGVITPDAVIGGQPIYSTVTNTIDALVPDTLMNFLMQNIVAPSAAVIGGGISSSIQNHIPFSRGPRPQPRENPTPETPTSNDDGDTPRTTPPSTTGTPGGGGGGQPGEQQPASPEAAQEPVDEARTALSDQVNTQYGNLIGAPDGASAPQPTPEGSQETSSEPAEGASESAEPSGPGSAPTQPNGTGNGPEGEVGQVNPETTDADRDNYRRVVNAIIGNEPGVTEELIGFMTSPNDVFLSDEEQARMVDLWNGLPEDTQRSILLYENSQTDSPYGLHFRNQIRPDQQ